MDLKGERAGGVAEEARPQEKQLRSWSGPWVAKTPLRSLEAEVRVVT